MFGTELLSTPGVRWNIMRMRVFKWKHSTEKPFSNAHPAWFNENLIPDKWWFDFFFWLVHFC